MKRPRIIESLHFDDCPSCKNTLDILNGTLNKLNISKEVILIHVETQEEIEDNKFTGSPTTRINGEDLFPTVQTNYALGCRVYQTPDDYKGWPTEAMILEKLHNL